MDYTIANNLNNAFDYSIKTYIIASNEIYAIDHSITFLVIAHHINFAIDPLTSSYDCLQSQSCYCLKPCIETSIILYKEQTYII